MRFRRNGSGRGVGLSVALFCLGFTSPLLAQNDPPAETEESTPEPSAGTPATEAPAPDKPADTATPATTTATATVEPPAPAEVKPPEPGPGPAPADPQRERAVAYVGVERLPGSAYPAPRTRGITGGSLWLTMHGLQWPYMPEYSGAPAMRIGVSGSVWTDGSYAYIDSGLSDDPKSPVADRKRLLVQSRGVLRVTPTYSLNNGWFAQGQAEFVALGDTQISSSGAMGTTDDLWVRIGKWNVFDVTAGRMQGWEIANHYGMGLDLNTLERRGAEIEDQNAKPKPAYGLTYFWDRTEGNLGDYAVHLYPTNFLRFELLGQFGAGKNLGTSFQTNVRPSGILDFGYVKLKAGYEFGKALAQEQGDSVSAKMDSQRNGFGVALQGVLDPYLEGGVSFARGYEDLDAPTTGEPSRIDSNTVTGIAGFVNGRIYGPLILGAGALYSHWENLAPDERPGSPHQGEVDFDRQFQAFGAVQYSLWDTIFFKFVGSYAHFRHQDRRSTPFANTLLGGRFRMMVLF